jgi:hypothetical protein
LGRTHSERPAAPGARGWLAALALSLAAGLAALAPALPAWRSRAVGDLYIDLAAHLWTLWWARQPGRDALVNHPHGGVDFYIIEPVNAALHALLEPALGAAGAHNTAALLAVTLAGLGGYALGAQLTRSAAGGLAAGGLLAWAPSTLEALVDGTGEFMWTGLVALCLAAFVRLGRPSGRWGVPLAAGSLWLVATACWYYGLFAGLAALTWWALAPWRGGPQRWGAFRRMALAAGLGAALLAPSIGRFRGSDLEWARPRAERFVDHLLNPDLSGEPDPLESRLTPAFTRRAPAGEPAPPSRAGWRLAALGLALLGIGRLRGAALPWAGLMVGGWLLAQGSATAGGAPLPFVLLGRLFSYYLGPLHVPFHFGLLATLGACGLAAHAAAGPRGRLALGLAGAAVVGGGLWHGVGFWPLPTSAIPAPPALAALAADPAPGAVVDLPGLLDDDQHALDREALHQRVHGRPIPRFPVIPTSMVHTEGLRAARGSALGAAVAGRSRLEVAPPVGELLGLGYRWIVLDLETGAELRPRLDEWFGPARWEDGVVAVYAIEER